MAFFPMTFPFYFDPSDAYSPFRPVVEEANRSFGLITSGQRAFSGDSPAVRVFGITPSASRPFDDDTHEGRH